MNSKTESVTVWAVVARTAGGWRAWAVASTDPACRGHASSLVSPGTAQALLVTRLRSRQRQRQAGRPLCWRWFDRRRHFRPGQAAHVYASGREGLTRAPLAVTFRRYLADGMALVDCGHGPGGELVVAAVSAAALEPVAPAAPWQE